MSASSVITAIRSILTGAGYNVALLRLVDEEADTFPLVGVYLADEGETAELAGVTIERRTVSLDIALCVEVSMGDDEINVLTATETLRDLLVTHAPDILTRLPNGAELTVDAINVDLREPTSNIGVGHVLLTALYCTPPTR